MATLLNSIIEYKGRKFEFYDSTTAGCIGCPFAVKEDIEIFGKCKRGNELNLNLKKSNYDDITLFCTYNYKFREIFEINF